MKLFILFLLLSSTLGHCIPEETFSLLWKEEALPHFQGMNHGYLTNAQGMKLKYFFEVKPENRKNLIIVPGRTEPAIKYAELIYDLRHWNHNIFIFDHQGQGESDRLLKDHHKGHVIRFTDYVRDFELFIDQVVKPHGASDFYLIAHSMGAAISVRFMEKNPDFFEKAVLSAPMFELNTKPYSEQVARYFSGLLILARRGTHYAPDRGPYIPEEDTFEVNEVTHSPVRFEASKYLFTRFPHLAVGGPTSRWVNQSLKGTRNIDGIASKIETPILLLQAGMDLIVKPRRQDAFCKKAHCQFKLYPESHHEILMEKDSIRDQALTDIAAFFRF